MEAGLAMQLDVKDAAGIFNVPEKTIYRWIKQKNLPSCELDERYRFNRAELLEWATEHKIDVSAEIMNEPEEGEAPPPRLDEALRLGGVCHNVEGTDKASALGAVVEIMHLPRDVDRTFLYQVLLARESLGSTGIGEGIAIPHVRHPIVLHTLHPTITLCFLKHPIDFGAPDGQPVDILFTLVSPTVHAHQRLLSKLAYALKDPRFKAVLARRGSREDILREAGRVEKGISLQSSGSHS
jgi:nitrogen PTS system EIIA component